MNFSQARRIVIKVGTSTLTGGREQLDQERISDLVEQLAELHYQGREVVLVSSGAIRAGLARVGQSLFAPGAEPARRAHASPSVPQKQALASIGQGILLQSYEKLFAAHGITIAQVLLTRYDFRSPQHRAACAQTFSHLLRWRVIPVVNENDAVASDEIRVGDNDTLSAMVAALLQAHLLILLTDTEGLYTADPRLADDAQLIPVVDQITPRIARAAGGAGSDGGTGGMVTKLKAARLATAEGVPVVVANGSRPAILPAVLGPEAVGTVFLPRPRKKVQGNNKGTAGVCPPPVAARGRYER